MDPNCLKPRRESNAIELTGFLDGTVLGKEQILRQPSRPKAAGGTKPFFVREASNQVTDATTAR